MLLDGAQRKHDHRFRIAGEPGGFLVRAFGEPNHLRFVTPALAPAPAPRSSRGARRGHDRAWPRCSTPKEWGTAPARASRVKIRDSVSDLLDSVERMFKADLPDTSGESCPAGTPGRTGACIANSEEGARLACGKCRLRSCPAPAAPPHGCNCCHSGEHATNHQRRSCSSPYRSCDTCEVLSARRRVGAMDSSA